MTVNLPEILIANGVAFLMLFMVFISKTWRLNERSSEVKILRAMLIVAMIGCLADPIAFLGDNRPGSFARALVYGGNFIFFLINLMIAALWIDLIAIRCFGSLPKKYGRIMWFILGIGFIGLVVNLFVPFIYSVDENNVYSRGTFAPLYTVLVGVMLIIGMVVYSIAKHRGGILRFFPVIRFAIPFIIGFTLQCIFYGISTIWPFASVSIIGMFMGLESEYIFKDRLTGLYNRFYLDYLKSVADKKASSPFTIMMADMNGFKSINDTFGHNEGDLALIAVADILVNSIGSYGSVIRYAGDEFLVILNSQDPAIIEECEFNFNSNIDHYNMTSGKGYKLSLSKGYECVDFSTTAVDTLLNEVDKKMYKEKELYYKSNDRRK